MSTASHGSEFPDALPASLKLLWEDPSFRAWIDPRCPLPASPMVEHVDGFRRDVLDESMRPAYAKSMAKLLACFVEACGFWEPADVTARVADQWLASREVGDRTRNMQRYWVRRFSRWLLTQGLLEKNQLCPTRRRPSGPAKKKRGPPVAARTFYFLELYGAYGQPTYHNLRAILAHWNALPEAHRKSIDAENFQTLPAGDDAQIQRSAVTIHRSVCHARNARAGQRAKAPHLTTSTGSIGTVGDLFSFWRSPGQDLTGPQCRDRWNAFPEKIRTALGGHPPWSDKLPPGGHGAGLALMRARRSEKRRLESSFDGRTRYALEKRAAGWKGGEIQRGWDGTPLVVRKEKSPTNFRSFKTGSAVNDLLCRARQKLNGSKPKPPFGKPPGPANPSRDKLCLRRKREGVAAPEIGKELGISADAVRQAVIRAKAQEDPAAALDRLRTRPHWGFDHHMLELYENATNKATYHSPSGCLDAWLSYTPAQKKALCAKLGTTRSTPHLSPAPGRRHFASRWIVACIARARRERDVEGRLSASNRPHRARPRRNRARIAGNGHTITDRPPRRPRSPARRRSSKLQGDLVRPWRTVSGERPREAPLPPAQYQVMLTAIRAVGPASPVEPSDAKNQACAMPWTA